MDYELPKSIKRYSFWCGKIMDFANFNKCSKLCRACQTGNLECWQKNATRDIIQDCEVTNEKNAERVAMCPECNSDNIVGCAFNQFLCTSCGAVFDLDKNQQKICLGDQYLEINMSQLEGQFQKAKESLKQ